METGDPKLLWSPKMLSTVSTKLPIFIAFLKSDIFFSIIVSFISKTSEEMLEN